MSSPSATFLSRFGRLLPCGQLLVRVRLFWPLTGLLVGLSQDLVHLSFDDLVHVILHWLRDCVCLPMLVASDFVRDDVAWLAGTLCLIVCCAHVCIASGLRIVTHQIRLSVLRCHRHRRRAFELVFGWLFNVDVRPLWWFIDRLYVLVVAGAGLT